MISVLFELEWVEFGIFQLIPAYSSFPRPEKSQKECGLSQETAERIKVNELLV